MSKFKIGDKVRIIETNFNKGDDFSKYIDKIATITKIYADNCYEIDLDKGKYQWFEEEFELYERKPNTYTIHNLLNDFDEGTVFQCVGLRYRIYHGSLYCLDTEEQTSIWEKSINSLKQILDMKFTKVEEPKKLKSMTFEEAVRTGNKIKYCYDGYTLDKFYTIQNIFKHLISPMYGNETVSSIILNNTWYAEGVYE